MNYTPEKINLPRDNTELHPKDCNLLGQWYSTAGTRTPGGTRRHLRGYVDYTICITCIMYQQLWGYKVEEILYLGVREQKRLNTTGLGYITLILSLHQNSDKY
jgi:hypothetical protein